MSSKLFSIFALIVVLSLIVSGYSKNLSQSILTLNGALNKSTGTKVVGSQNIEGTAPISSTGALLIKNVYGTGDDTEGLHYCNGKLPVFNKNETTEICYTIKQGDTLWSVAEKYYGSGFKWNKIWTYQEDGHKIKNIKDIAPGVQVIIYSLASNDMFLYEGYSFINSLSIDSKTEEIFTVSRNNGYGAVVNVGKKLYDGPFEFVQSFFIDWRTNNKIYLVDDSKEKLCEQDESNRKGLRVIFNKNRNEYYGCGWDYKLLTFSPSGKHYAVRNNEGKNRYNEKFLVLSDIGNSQFYDYVDSMFWDKYNNLYYRAKINDRWVVAVNNVNGEKFNYLEDLKIENDVVKYKARNDNGAWVEKIFSY